MITSAFAAIRKTARTVFAVEGRSSYVMVPFVGAAHASTGQSQFNGPGRTGVWAMGGRADLTVHLRDLEIVMDRRRGAPAWLAWPVLAVTSLAMLVLWPEHYTQVWMGLSRDEHLPRTGVCDNSGGELEAV